MPRKRFRLDFFDSSQSDPAVPAAPYSPLVVDPDTVELVNSMLRRSRLQPSTDPEQDDMDPCLAPPEFNLQPPTSEEQAEHAILEELEQGDAAEFMQG